MELKQQLGSHFTSKLDTIEAEATKIWQKGELYHPYYTLHGLDHSRQVIRILEKLIEGLNPVDNLNKKEVFCLHCKKREQLLDVQLTEKGEK
jgi:hypothetical protein